MGQDNKPHVHRGTARIVCGSICAAFGLIGFSTSAADGFDSMDVVMVLLFLGGGALLLFFGIKARMRFEKYRRYASIIANKNQTNLDYIAVETKDSPQKVSEVLLAMLEAGFFPGAHIDDYSRILVLPNSSAPRQMATAQPTIQKCLGCGANNTVIAGRINECEYCGSPLKPS